MNTADAISKLTEALMINPLNHETLWLLGNCFANQALMACDLNKINHYKAKASASYQKALEMVATAFILLLSHSLSSINLIEVNGGICFCRIQEMRLTSGLWKSLPR